MKSVFFVLLIGVATDFSCSSKIEKSSRGSGIAIDVRESKKPDSKKLFFDVHNLDPGRVSLDVVAGAHQKGLDIQEMFGVNFLRYWVDEEGGRVFCLVEAPDSASIYDCHKEAHGLVPDLVEQVTGGRNTLVRIHRPLFFDVHELGAGKVTAAAVADAHDKDLEVQDEYGVNFVSYWVAERTGTLRCLVEAKDEQSLIDAHKEAHGLIPNEVRRVKEGK